MQIARQLNRITGQLNRGYHGRQRRGVTTVEVAITFPILMVLIMLVFDVSRMMMVQQCLGFAAEEGCRHASLATTLTQAEVVSVTRPSLQVAIPNNSPDGLVSVTPSLSAGTSSGTTMVVNLQVSMSDVSWLPGGILNFLGNPTLTARAVQDRE